jgi:uncharacterized protein
LSRAAFLYGIWKTVPCAVFILAMSFIISMSGMVLADDVSFTQESLKITGADGRQTVFTIELADTDAERERGLMYRDEMADDHGMLFDFGTTRNVMMWMQDTKISLDMLFITSDYKIVTIARSAVPYSQDIIFSKVPVAYVLEVKAGTVDRLGIKVGDHIERIQ